MFKLFSSSSSSPSCCSSLTALQSNADLPLFSGILPVNSVFWSLFFPIRDFAFINIGLYTFSQFAFCPSLSRLPWGLLSNSYTVHYVNMTTPIQRTYSDVCIESIMWNKFVGGICFISARAPYCFTLHKSQINLILL